MMIGTYISCSLALDFNSSAYYYVNNLIELELSLLALDNSQVLHYEHYLHREIFILCHLVPTSPELLNFEY